jgi:hypothetical protein
MLLKLYKLGHALVANPLMARMPRLIYGLLGTCNQFGHLQVKNQWDFIRKFYKKIFGKRWRPFRRPCFGWK